MAASWRRLLLCTVTMNLLCNSLILADLSQRALDEENEVVLVRKERQYSGLNNAGYNSLVNVVQTYLTGFVINPPTNTVVSNSSTFTILPEFWRTFFNMLQYGTYVLFFVSIGTMYIVGVGVLFIISIVSPESTDHVSTVVFPGSLFQRSFDDENKPLFDKITSVGYGILDRSNELYNLIQSPACYRYAMCHTSATLGDQEANGFIFKDLFRSLSATLDNKAGTEGMTRSVNVGLLTGDCDEPIMSCPELAPYFKKVADTWSSYL